MGIKTAVIDANVLLALIDEKDKWHPRASVLARALRENNWKIIYLDCVLNEVVSVLGRRLEERKEPKSFRNFLEILEDLVPESQIEWVYPDVPALYSNIMKMIKENEGRLNFHDALISLFMKEQGLEHIVSFDTDFDEVKKVNRIDNEKEIKKSVFGNRKK